MNTSLQDGYNISWKLAQLLRGQAKPELLKTNVLERERVARDLIDFDRYFSKLFSSTGAAADAHSALEFSEQLAKSGRYTAVLAAKHADSVITCAARSTQSLAQNAVVGMRFPTAQVVPFCDARAM
jgi:phenol 2-monooxygenase